MWSCDSDSLSTNQCKNVDPASTLRHFLSVSNFNQYNSVLYVNYKQLDLVMSGSVCEVTRCESPMVPEDSHNPEDAHISDIDLSMVMLCGICSTYIVQINKLDRVFKLF